MRDQSTRIAAAAIASAVIYYLALVRPYSLLSWAHMPLLTPGIMANRDSTAALAFVAALVALFFLYLAVLRSSRTGATRRTWAVVIVGALGFNIVLLFLYPIGAADVFDNIFRGRMQSEYGASPFFQVPASFWNDPFARYIAWSQSPTAYGPLWEMVSRSLAGVVGAEVVPAVLGYKLLAVAAYAATAALIVALLWKIAPDRALSGFILFSWNPLVLYSTAGNGHNDALMMMFVVGSFYLAYSGRWTLSALAMTAGALVKFVPLILLPLILVLGARQLPSTRERATYVLVTALACCALVTAAYAPYWQPGASLAELLSVERRAEMFTSSLPTLATMALVPLLGMEEAHTVVRQAAVLLLALWAGWRYFEAWRFGAVSSLPVASALIILFYLLVSILWFQPWYVIWPLAIVAFLPRSGLTWLSVLLSFTVMLKIPVTDFVLFKDDIWQQLDIRNAYLTLALLGVPWLHGLYLAIRAATNRIRHAKPKTPRPV